MTATRKPTKRSTPAFTAEERAAMKERVKEQKAAADSAEQEKALLEKIAEMPKPDRTMAERLHALITSTAPDLAPKLWYGMPAYARNGEIVCFFQPADKFKARYATLGFNDPANLDDGNMWPTAFALTKLTKADEKRIGELVKKATS
jgi:uncharacterized protein YdhG (YjbR/CyaY superfamily)